MLRRGHDVATHSHSAMRHFRFAVGLMVVGVAQSAAQPVRGDWTAYGRDGLGSRYSTLSQITRENVSRLTIAWTYRTGEMEATRQTAKFEATPLVVDGTM